MKKKNLVWEIRPKGSSKLMDDALGVAEDKDIPVEMTMRGKLCELSTSRVAPSQVLIDLPNSAQSAMLVPRQRQCIGVGEYIVTAEVLNYDGEGEPSEAGIVSGDMFHEEDAIVTFYWNTGLQWGTIYTVETMLYKYMFPPSPAHACPPDKSAVTLYRLTDKEAGSADEILAEMTGYVEEMYEEEPAPAPAAPAKK